MTGYAEAELDACLERLGIDTKTQLIPRPLCTSKQFRDLIRGGKLIVTNSRPHGIPQGAQISAILSNISMIRFDQQMYAASARMGGSYRRYSDDILLIVDAQYSKADVEKAVKDGLHLLGPAMKLNRDKTEVAQFVRNMDGRLLCDKQGGVQYLGFTFDGERRLIRSQTMSKYARRLVYAVRGAKKDAKAAGKPVYRRSIYRRFSHLGKGNFLSRYAKAAQAQMPGDAIRRQVRRHMRRIHAEFDREDELPPMVPAVEPRPL
jgi:hypothetical protein